MQQKKNSGRGQILFHSTVYRHIEKSCICKLLGYTVLLQLLYKGNKGENVALNKLYFCRQEANADEFEDKEWTFVIEGVSKTLRFNI